MHGWSGKPSQPDPREKMTSEDVAEEVARSLVKFGFSVELHYPAIENGMAHITADNARTGEHFVLTVGRK